MKKTGLFAVLLAAALTTASFAGCLDKNSSSSSRVRQSSNIPTSIEAIGSNVVDGEMGKEVTENDTGFTLNSVISAKNSETGEQFIYMDITLRNNTDKQYTLSTLNNFYIELPDGSKAESDVRTQLYAKQNFNESKYYADPFDIPSNGQFSGVIGGIAVSGDASDFKLCFFPTGDNPRAKGTVIKYDITSGDIHAPAAEMLK
ncbi:DUF4352 domain-containing protein [Ruminococcus flavefaciens]|uniref:DUF4352 domain-containing protein n=1 Tax=Ruminococcus flavefaciens TaxID=1265 RepID=UPI0026ECFA82|nr:DUF4352 domain-containing protein [Ruminococcus flavefaciens]